jgi:hypothetical protein
MMGLHAIHMAICDEYTFGVANGSMIMHTLSNIMIVDVIFWEGMPNHMPLDLTSGPTFLPLWSRKGGPAYV